MSVPCLLGTMCACSTCTVINQQKHEPGIGSSSCSFWQVALSQVWYLVHKLRLERTRYITVTQTRPPPLPQSRLNEKTEHGCLNFATNFLKLCKVFLEKREIVHVYLHRHKLNVSHLQAG